MESARTPSGSGHKRRRSPSCSRSGGSLSTTDGRSSSSSGGRTTDPSAPGSSTPTSAPPTKPRTSRGKSKSSKPSTRSTKSSGTSGRTSSSNGAVRPFWNAWCPGLSARLRLPTGTGSHGSASSSSSGCSSGSRTDSWFSIVWTEGSTPERMTPGSSPTTWSPSPASLWRSITGFAARRIGLAEKLRLSELAEKEAKKRKKPPRKKQKRQQDGEDAAPEKPPAAKAIKVRLYPTAEQRQKLFEVAGKCPVHRTLTGTISIETADDLLPA